MPGQFWKPRASLGQLISKTTKLYEFFHSQLVPKALNTTSVHIFDRVLLSFQDDKTSAALGLNPLPLNEIKTKCD